MIKGCKGVFNQNEKEKEEELEEELSDIKYDLRKKGLVPVLDNDTLRIYKVKSNENLNEIIAYFKEEYKSLFEDVILKTDIIPDDRMYREIEICRAMGIDIDITTINTRPAKIEEVEKKLGLDDEIKRNSFYLINARNIEVDVPLNDEIWVKGYRKERINEVISRIAQKYIVRTREKDSKIAKFLKLIDSPYYNLDLIAEIICRFYNDESVVHFSTGVNVLERGQQSVETMAFSDTEKELSEEEKIFCIKKMLEGFDIECVFDSKIENISDFQFKTIAKTKLLKPQEAILDFARHNSDIINNENVSNIINQIKKTSAKKFKMKNKK